MNITKEMCLKNKYNVLNCKENTSYLLSAGYKEQKILYPCLTVPQAKGLDMHLTAEAEGFYFPSSETTSASCKGRVNLTW